MKDRFEAKFAWIIWNLLSSLNDVIWTRYEKNFIDFILQEDIEIFKKSKSQDAIPF